MPSSTTSISPKPPEGPRVYSRSPRSTAFRGLLMAEIYEERGEAEMALELLKRALAARSVTSAA
jgi:hypothetical protein